MNRNDAGVPELTKEQRLEALESAMRARTKRAEFRQKVIDENMPIEKAIAMAAEDETLGKIKAMDLIRYYKGYGKMKAAKLMDRLGIAHSRRIRGLGPVQRRNLAKAIDER